MYQALKCPYLLFESVGVLSEGAFSPLLSLSKTLNVKANRKFSKNELISKMKKKCFANIY